MLIEPQIEKLMLSIFYMLILDSHVVHGCPSWSTSSKRYKNWIWTVSGVQLPTGFAAARARILQSVCLTSRGIKVIAVIGL